MRLAKFALACLLSLGVCVQGFASVAMLEDPCPMTQTGDEAVVDSVMYSETEHDCCNDAETFDKTGKLCKTDLSCQSLSYASQTPYNLVLLVMTAEPTVPFPDRVIRLHDPTPVWRPPALI